MQIDLSATWLIAFLLVMARAVAWMSVVTPFSSKAVPRVVTIGVGAGLAILVASQLQHSGVPTTTGGLVGALGLQVVTGVALGFVVQLLLTAVSTAGSFLDITSGLNLTPSIDPLTGVQTPLMGQFYSQVMVLLLFASNGYLLMIEGFERSFSGPGFTLAASKIVSTVMLTDFEVFFVSALEIAAPIMIVLFGAQVVLALLSKAAPQTNVWLLGFPFQIFLALVIVAVAMSALPNDVTNLLTRALGDGARMFGGH